MADTELIDHTGRTVFRGTQKPPGGGSQTLEQVLTAGADGGAVGMANTGTIDMGGAAMVQGDGTQTVQLDVSGGLVLDDGAGLTTTITPGSASVDGATGFATLDAANGRVIARPATGEVALSVSATNGPGGCIDPNGVALVPAADRQVLDPATCTPGDIANALIALGLAKAS